jgi:hypothetical protein
LPTANTGSSSAGGGPMSNVPTPLGSWLNET